MITKKNYDLFSFFMRKWVVFLWKKLLNRSVLIAPLCKIESQNTKGRG